MVGIRIPDSALSVPELVAIYASPALILATVVLSILRRRSAWRAWVFLLLGFVANIIVLIPRVAAFGPDVAYVTRYYTEAGYLVPLAVACAFAVPRREINLSSPLRLPAPRVAVATGLALAVYVALVAISDSGKVVPDTGVRVRPWVDRVEAGLQRARRLDPRPALLDGRVPNDVVASFSPPPQNRFSAVVPTLTAECRSTWPPRIYRITARGAVVPVAFERSAGGPLPGAGSPRDRHRTGRLTAHAGRIGVRPARQRQRHVAVPAPPVAGRPGALVGARALHVLDAAGTCAERRLELAGWGVDPLPHRR